MKGKVITGLKFFLITKWKDTRDQNVVRDGRNGAGLMCVWIIEMDDSAHKLGVEFDSTKAKLGLGACV